MNQQPTSRGSILPLPLHRWQETKPWTYLLNHKHRSYNDLCVVAIHSPMSWDSKIKDYLQKQCSFETFDTTRSKSYKIELWRVTKGACEDQICGSHGFEGFIHTRFFSNWIILTILRGYSLDSWGLLIYVVARLSSPSLKSPEILNARCKKLHTNSAGWKTVGICC